MSATCVLINSLMFRILTRFMRFAFCASCMYRNIVWRRQALHVQYINIVIIVHGKAEVKILAVLVFTLNAHFQWNTVWQLLVTYSNSPPPMAAGENKDYIIILCACFTIVPWFNRRSIYREATVSFYFTLYFTHLWEVQEVNLSLNMKKIIALIQEHENKFPVQQKIICYIGFDYKLWYTLAPMIYRMPESYNIPPFRIILYHLLKVKKCISVWICKASLFLLPSAVLLNSKGII